MLQIPLIRKSLFIFSLFGCLLTPSPSQAYVTSATLELMADDKAGVYLNGKMLLDDKRCEMLYNWFMCLSTSDGTLPLELFKNNEDNLLGIINYDVYGGDAEISYRLTVHQSSGDPIIIMAEPGETRFKNMHRNEPDPPGWFLSNFDDSGWPFAKEMVGIGGNYIRLPAPNLKTFLGAQGYVPIAAPTSDGKTIPQDRTLYRNHFSFPNAISKADLRTNPKVASRGQLVAVRIIPGRDVADISNFSVVAQLPVGLEPTQINDRGFYSAASRKIRWDYRDVGKMAQYLTFSAQTLISASGWKNAERALGPFKPELKAWHDGGSTPAEQKQMGAAFWPGMPAWFKMGSLPYTDGPESPVVLGIIFRVQHMAGGSDTPYKKGVNDIYMNYSIHGKEENALSEDVRVSYCANTGMWQTGYYDASEDRKWTWADLNNLKVKIQSRQFGNRQLGRIISVQATVRALTLQKCAPTFLAKVDSAKCEYLKINAGIAQADGKAMASDPFTLSVNPQLCAAQVVPTRYVPPTATAIPTSTPIPRPGVTPPTPIPTPTAVPTLPGLALVGEPISLGCLRSAPEPFKRGGVFIYFCVKRDAEVSVIVTKPSGETVRTIPAVSSRAGENQIFFNSLDDQGRQLRPGPYVYILKAVSSDGHVDQRNGNFTRAKD